MSPDKTMRVPLSDAREGCRQLIEKVRAHLACAATLMLKGEHSHRFLGASLFVLLGFEESGKLLQLIQASARAETEHASIVELKDFRDHEGKAGLTTEYVVRVLNHITSALRSAGFSDEAFGGYLDHLIPVGKGFLTIRANDQFVAYLDGTCAASRSLSGEFLGVGLGGFCV